MGTSDQVMADLSLVKEKLFKKFMGLLMKNYLCTGLTIILEARGEVQEADPVNDDEDENSLTGSKEATPEPRKKPRRKGAKDKREFFYLYRTIWLT